VVTHQLQVERRTAKAHRPKTDALPLDHAANLELDIWRLVTCGHGLQHSSYFLMRKATFTLELLTIAAVTRITHTVKKSV